MPTAKKTTTKIAAAKQLTADKPVHKNYDYLAAVGRRKSAIARVRLYQRGSGKVTVNTLDLTKYFPTYDLHTPVLQPLRTAGVETTVDLTIKVSGGGKRGQSEAVRHGVARALVLMNEDFRKALRTAGFLTRDSRVKERKKPGLKKARRAPQFSKR